MDRVFDAALRLLSFRPRSEAEVRRRLIRRFSSTLVDEAIASLKNRGLLDDAAFARFWRENRERHRPRGYSAMKWELVRMGVTGEIAEDALLDVDEEANAYRAAQGTLRRLEHTDYDVFRRKLTAYLQRRGFRFRVVQRTVQQMWQELSHSADGDVEGEAQTDQSKDIT